MNNGSIWRPNTSQATSTTTTETSRMIALRWPRGGGPISSTSGATSSTTASAESDTASDGGA
jgi:hypothetical protein